MSEFDGVIWKPLDALVLHGDVVTILCTYWLPDENKFCATNNSCAMPAKDGAREFRCVQCRMPLRVTWRAKEGLGAWRAFQ